MWKMLYAMQEAEKGEHGHSRSLNGVDHTANRLAVGMADDVEKGKSE